LKEYLKNLILQKGYDPDEFLKPWITLLSKNLLEMPFEQPDLSYSRIEKKVIFAGSRIPPIRAWATPSANRFRKGIAI